MYKEISLAPFFLDFQFPSPGANMVTSFLKVVLQWFFVSFSDCTTAGNVLLRLASFLPCSCTHCSLPPATPSFWSPNPAHPAVCSSHLLQEEFFFLAIRLLSSLLPDITISVTYMDIFSHPVYQLLVSNCLVWATLTHFLNQPAGWFPFTWLPLPPTPWSNPLSWASDIIPVEIVHLPSCPLGTSKTSFLPLTYSTFRITSLNEWHQYLFSHPNLKLQSPKLCTL